jgi:hypothetical protein
MLNPTSFIVAALLATASCAPVTSIPQGESTSSIQARGSINDCDDSSFTNASSGGSPLVADCKIMASNIAGGGTWVSRSLLFVYSLLIGYYRPRYSQNSAHSSRTELAPLESRVSVVAQEWPGSSTLATRTLSILSMKAFAGLSGTASLVQAAR